MQGTLQELSSPSDGFVIMEFPHVPYNLVSDYVPFRALSAAHIDHQLPMRSISSPRRAMHTVLHSQQYSWQQSTECTGLQNIPRTRKLSLI